VYRFRFVTVIGWAFVVVAMSKVITGIQGVLNFPQVQMMQAIFPPHFPPAIATITRLENDYYVPLKVAGLILSLALLVSAIGLLQHKGWARVSLIALLVFSCITIVAVTIIQFSVVSVLPQYIPIGTSLAILILYLWIIMQLRSDSVKKEFVASENYVV
jgi:hypothetical protein